jgi:4-amino-4-deoxy-L-arabinose transferase-like glycosyltransferase
VLLLGSLAVWTLAYQQKASYTVDVGGLYDDAFIADFHDKEANTELNYRWTQSSSLVTFPGVGNEPVNLSLTTIGNRLGGSPPVLTVQARGKTFTVQTSSTARTDTIFLERGDPFNGNLVVTLSSPVFTPPSDQREHGLGVIVDRVTVSPADYGLRPIVVPPTGTLMGMLAGILSAYLVMLVAFQRVRYGLLAAGALSLVLAVLVLSARLELGLLAWQLPGLGLLAVFLAIAGKVLLDKALPRSRQLAVLTCLGSLAFVVAFVVRFGGLIYPQFRSSDLLFQAHRMQWVMQGNWVFPSALPDGTAVPYPPALFVILTPLGWLFGNSDETISLILKASMALLDSLTCLGLAWAGWRLWGGRAGGLAALVYALSPAPFELFSAGNYTNLFAQGFLNLTLLGCLVYLDGRGVRRAGLWVGVLSAGFVLTMLGHYGVMLATLPIVGLFGLWTIVETVRGKRPVRSWKLLSGFVLSLVASFAFYYRHFLVEMWEQMSAIVRRLGSPGNGGAVDTSGVPLRQEPLYERLVRKVSALVGLPATLSAVFGLALPSPTRRIESVEPRPCGMGRQALALLLSWLGASALFLLLDQTLGDAVRWYYLAAAAIALLAGRFLARLSSKGRAGWLLLGLVLSLLLFQLLGTWVGDQIFTRYHDIAPIR